MNDREILLLCYGAIKVTNGIEGTADFTEIIDLVEEHLYPKFPESPFEKDESFLKDVAHNRMPPGTLAK